MHKNKKISVIDTDSYMLTDMDYKDLIRELSGHALAAFMRKQKCEEQKLYDVIDQMDAVVKMDKIDPESYVDDDD